MFSLCGIHINGWFEPTEECSNKYGTERVKSSTHVTPVVLGQTVWPAIITLEPPRTSVGQSVSKHYTPILQNKFEVRREWLLTKSGVRGRNTTTVLCF